MDKLSQEDMSSIKKLYFSLGPDTRRKIMTVAHGLSDDDEQTLYSLILYFSDDANTDELNSVFSELSDGSLYDGSEIVTTNKPTARSVRGKNANS